MGGLAGFLAGQIIKGKGFGILRNVIIGIAGSLFGKLVFWLIGFSFGYGIIGSLLTATIGAVLLVLLVNWVLGNKDK